MRIAVLLSALLLAGCGLRWTFTVTAFPTVSGSVTVEAQTYPQTMPAATQGAGK